MTTPYGSLNYTSMHEVYEHGLKLPFLLYLALLLIVQFPFRAAGAQAQTALPQIEGDGPHNHAVVRAVGEKGRYVGFDLLIDDKLTVPVRFASGDAISAPDAVVGTRNGAQTLTFDHLNGSPESGLELESSRIEISLPDHQFPVIAYALHVKAFNTVLWQQTLGNNPFHFLALSLPEATLLHHNGLLTPTPKADPFPLLDDVPSGSVRRSAYPYNRQWSLRSPLCEQAMPVIGLWASTRRLYAGWDFLPTSLDSVQPEELSTAYCNRLVLPQGKGATREDASATAYRLSDREGRTKFVALVYPRGERDYHQFLYPQGGEQFSGQATLVYHTDLGDTDDPNRLLWESWWSNPTLRRRIPTALPPVSFAWTGRILDALPAPPTKPLLQNSAKGLTLDSRIWLDENPLEIAYQQSDNPHLALLEGEAGLLLRRVVRFKAGGEDCVYWRKPLDSDTTDAEAGSTMLHHSDGWDAGRLLLALYRHNPKKVSPTVIQGVFHWAKHCVWQRFSDEIDPGQPAIEDSVRTAAFLLDYYATFKRDATRRSDAMLALEMARICAFRALAMHPLDNPVGMRAFYWGTAEGDGLSNSLYARRLACVLEGLTQAAVMTGDPILLWAVQGSLGLSRFRTSEREGEGVRGRMVSTTTKESDADALNLLLPVGDSALRVFAGEKAALAFARNKTATSVRNYRCTGLGDFAITFQSSLPDFAATVTFPYADLSRRAVWLLRDGIIKTPLKPGERLFRNADALWSLTVTGLRDRDTLIVGDPDLAQAENLPVGGVARPAFRR